MIDIPPQEFERLVEEALEGLPARFARLLDNVVVIVEEEPSDEDLELTDGDNELLGLFRGIAITRRHYDAIAPMPNQISIFRGPILRVSRNRRQALHEIRETVIHELGHYFGLSDEEM